MIEDVREVISEYEGGHVVRHTLIYFTAADGVLCSAYVNPKMPLGLKWYEGEVMQKDANNVIPNKRAD